MFMHRWTDIVRNWISQGTRSRKLSRQAIRRRRPAGPQMAMERLEARVLLSAVIVTGTGDSMVVDGVVTLREAITSINLGADLNADVVGVGAYGTNDAINFNIAGAGVQTISLESALPTIVNQVVVNGYTQAGSSANTFADIDNAIVLIELDGTGAGVGANGLVLGAGSDGSTVSGLVINRFSGSGIVVQSSDNTITGNFVGTNAAGDASLSTGAFGIAIEGTFRNTIGGTTPADRNVIGGNSDGIHLGASAQYTVIQGNFIGVGVDGTTPVGNRLHGIALQGDGGLGVQNNEIGGTVAGAGNIIANSGRAGVAIYGDPLDSRQNSGNTILGNSIYNNGLDSPATLPGIDLVSASSYPVEDGATLNDPLDADNGPNLLQNFPTLTSATSGAVSTTISGTLNSEPSTTYRIEFFSTPTVSATGFGEGQTFLGFANVTTDAAGFATFTATVGTPVPSGQFVTSTATSAGDATGLPPPVIGPGNLGTAQNFAVLGGSTVTITGPSVFIGDVGVSPGSAVDGSSFTTTGTIHAADAVAAQAQTDLTAAYTFFAGLGPFVDLTGQELGGMTLTPGIYHFDTSAQLTGPNPLILDTQGDPHALFVFQIGSTLTTASAVGSAVVVLGTTDSIFWQVGSSATIGVGTAFVGNILAQTSITLATGATLSSGRALARDGAVTLDTIVADSTTVGQNNTSEFSAAVQVDPSVSLSIAPATLAEAAGTSTVTATLSAISAQDVTVDLAFSGTAANVSDYTRSGLQIVILAGNTTGSITLTAVQDTLNEADETIVVDISGVTNSTEEGTQQVVATIADDDALPSVTLGVEPATLAEAAGTSTVTATLSTVSGQDVTVDLAFSGTAANVSDYTRSGVQIVILAGNTTGSVTLTAVQDTLNETDETIVVDISGVTNGTEEGTQQVVATIADDDALPSVTLGVEPATLAEAAGTSTVTATLSAVSGQDVTIDLAFSGTAANVSDYTRSGVQIVILAGNTTGSVTLTAVQDTLNEANETIVVDISGVTNGTEFGTQQVSATILDDDSASAPSVTLGVAPATLAEAAGTSTVTAMLSTISGQDVTVDLAFSGTATNTTDYTRSGVQIVIPAGQTTGTVTLIAVQDLLNEANETIVVDISGVTNGAELGTQQAVATILDDDLPPGVGVTLGIAPASLLESGGTSTVTATLSAISGQNVIVDLAFSGTAGNTTDYARSGVQIVIPAGSTTGTITLTAVQDALNEANESIVVDISGVTNGNELGTQQVIATILDDDSGSAPSVTLGVAPATLAEAAGTSTVTATLSTISGQNVIVDLAFSGTAGNTTDYTRSAVQIVIPAGQTTGSITLAAVQDSLIEGNESIIVDISGVTNGTELGTQQVFASIVDDDVATVSIAKIADGAETDTPTGGLFRVTQSAISTTDTVVQYAISGTATSGAGNDYIPLTGSVTILAGQTTADINVAVLNDSLVENTETVTVTLTGFGPHNPAVSLNAAAANLSATVNVTDDDPLVIISGAVAAVVENTATTTLVLDVDATPIPGQVLTYSLSGPDAGAFSINSATGEIFFAASPNFEAPTDQGGDNVYNVTVSVTADFAPPRSTALDLVITVLPVNDNAPQFVNPTPTFSVPENSAAGTVVGNAAATDADLPGELLTYVLVGGNQSGAFAINPATGVITVADPTKLNFEGTNAFTLNVQVTDNGSPTPLAANAVVVVNVTNVQESPIIHIPSPRPTYRLHQRPVYSSPDASITYADMANPDFSNATLTVSIVSGRSSNDKLKVKHKDKHGSTQIHTKGHKIFSGDEQIGTFEKGNNKHPDLVITLNGNADLSDVSDLLQQLNFRAKNNAGTIRMFEMQITDIAGVDSNVASLGMMVLPRT